ncbi:hypothetical protein [Haematobacter genomosp. 1]|nr:hypothetical protein [Haematobacter genomosp. 1]
MTPRDVATLVYGILAPGETTAVVETLTFIERAGFMTCEWFNWGQIEQVVNEGQELGAATYLGRCPPLMGSPTERPNALDAFSRVLALVGTDRPTLRIDDVKVSRGPDGVGVDISYSEEMPFGVAVDAFIAGTEDSSDVLRFPQFKPDTIMRWQFTAEFTCYVRQASQVWNTRRLQGGVVQELAMDALQT